MRLFFLKASRLYVKLGNNISEKAEKIAVSYAHIMRMSILKVIVMTMLQTSSVRKRAVNLTLNEDIVAQAKALTPNLSAVVETLLSGYVAQIQREKLSRQEQADQVAGVWNGFNARSGSFADEYSTL